MKLKKTDFNIKNQNKHFYLIKTINLEISHLIIKFLTKKSQTTNNKHILEEFE